MLPFEYRQTTTRRRGAELAPRAARLASRQRSRHTGPTCEGRKPTCRKGTAWQSVGDGTLALSRRSRGQTGFCSKMIGMAPTCSASSRSETSAATSESPCPRSGATFQSLSEQRKQRGTAAKHADAMRNRCRACRCCRARWAMHLMN